MAHTGHDMMNDTTMAAMMANTSMGDQHHHGDMMTSTADPHAGHDMSSMDHSGHQGSMDHAAGGHSMEMYFHTGLTQYILFESLKTNSVGSLVGACVAMFALSVLYEGLKFFREFLLRRASVAARHETYAPSTANGVVTTKQPEVGSRMLSGSHALQTLLHMIQVLISYCLMLVFMTYNVYLCVSIIVGAGLGYFLFGWRRAMVVDMNEHCH